MASMQTKSFKSLNGQFFLQNKATFMPNSIFNFSNFTRRVLVSVIMQTMYTLICICIVSLFLSYCEVDFFTLIAIERAGHCANKLVNGIAVVATTADQPPTNPSA